MTYPNLHAAADSLGRKLYTFAGHSIDSRHTSYCFDQMARAVEYIQREPAAKAANFDGEIFIKGKGFPVIVTVAGSDIYKPVDITIQMA